MPYKAIQYHDVLQKPLWKILAPLHIFCFREIFLFPCTIFVRFVTFFAHDSLPILRTTTKLLLGPLSIARGQKPKNNATCEAKWSVGLPYLASKKVNYTSKVRYRSTVPLCRQICENCLINSFFSSTIAFYIWGHRPLCPDGLIL